MKLTLGSATVLLVAVVSGVAGEPSEPRTQLAATAKEYDDFMKLTPDQRRARFDSLSAESKAGIVRTHAERWLGTNRGRLTASEAAVFEEIVAFFTPETFQAQSEGQLDDRERALRAKMRCRVSPEDVRDATHVLGPPRNSTPTTRWTYMRQANCWLEWMLEEFLAYIPVPGTDS